MATKFPIRDLPTGRPPSATPLFGTVVLDKWKADYDASDSAVRDRAIPELPLRASAVSKRCDRALWYSLTDTPETNPADAASQFRMMMGTMVHSLIEEALGEGQHDANGNPIGWHSEVVVDLRPAGFPGSAHADNIHYDELANPTVVVENKTLGGYDFKLRSTEFGSGPNGPRWEHIMQPAMVAVAVNAPKFLVVYWALDAVSHDQIAKQKLPSARRVVAEWEFNTDDWRDAVAVEAARQRRILHLADTGVVVERAVSTDEIPAGAVVINPSTGAWVTYSPTTGLVGQTGKYWLCGYCNHKDRCVADLEAEQDGDQYAR